MLTTKTVTLIVDTTDWIIIFTCEQSVTTDLTKAQPNENEGEKRHNACSLLVLGTELQAYVRDFETKGRHRTSSESKQA